MHNLMRKASSLLLSVAMVAASISTAELTVGAEVDPSLAAMVADSNYNLALGKPVTANPSKAEGREEALTDGNLEGEHAATTFDTQGTYYLVDLQQTYKAEGIDRIVFGYKEKNAGDTPVKGYEIEYSADGIHYTTVKKVSGSEVQETLTPDNLIGIQDVSGAQGNVRFIKIYYPDSYAWGIQLCEVAVLDTDSNVEKAQIEECNNAEAVVLTSDDYNTLNYTIVAGSGQENYQYVVYLDDKKLVEAGAVSGKQYTITGVPAGLHWLTVISVDGEKISSGVKSDNVSVEDISTLFSSTANIASRLNNPMAGIYSVSSYYEQGGYDITTVQAAVDGSLQTGEGKEVALRTGAGSPQEIVVDLGDYYVASELSRVALYYTNGNTYPENLKVELSRDAQNYVEVGTAKGYQYDKENPVASVRLSELGNYKSKAVRYVKITLSEGKTAYGYVVNEIAVVASTTEPSIYTHEFKEAADLIVNGDKFETIRYSVVAGEGQEYYSYIVKVDGAAVNENAVPGEVYETSAEVGEHVVSVSTLYDGWVSSGIERNVTVDGYGNYLRTALNLSYKISYPDVKVTCPDDNLVEGAVPGDGNYNVAVEGSQDISAGPAALNDGIYTNTNHHQGYLQTRSDREEAHIYYDLAKDYTPSDISMVISVFENQGRSPKSYEILFSGDGEKYERVFFTDNYTWKQMLCDKVDFSNYSQETIRYVEYHIISGIAPNNLNADGTINYGSDSYHMCELAVMGQESLLPARATNVRAVSNNYGEITVSWDDIEDPEATYSICMGDVALYSDIPSGVGEKTFLLSPGHYDNINVKTTKNGYTSNSANVSVTIEAEPTTAPPKTTAAPTTTVPQTMAPLQTTAAPVSYGEPTTEGKDLPKVQVGKAKVKKIVVKKKKAALTLKKINGAAGYQIRYSLNRKMKKAKIKKVKKTNVIIKKLKSKKIYYFQVRAYKFSGKKTVYGAWSRTKKSKKIK